MRGLENVWKSWAGKKLKFKDLRFKDLGKNHLFIIFPHHLIKKNIFLQPQIFIHKLL